MHERTWLQRNWKWLVAVGVLCVFLFIGSILLVISLAMKSGDAYQQGLAIAQQNQEVVAALGEPVEAGFFTSGSIQVSGPTGSADLAIPLSGPNGEGTLYVVAEKEAGRWTMSILEVEVDGRAERIQLLDQGVQQ